jgi:hypothetical protein
MDPTWPTRSPKARPLQSSRTRGARTTPRRAASRALTAAFESSLLRIPPSCAVRVVDESSTTSCPTMLCPCPQDAALFGAPPVPGWRVGIRREEQHALAGRGEDAEREGDFG